jgi:hypothetical protein
VDRKPPLSEQAFEVLLEHNADDVSVGGRARLWPGPTMRGVRAQRQQHSASVLLGLTAIELAAALAIHRCPAYLAPTRMTHLRTT